MHHFLCACNDWTSCLFTGNFLTVKGFLNAFLPFAVKNDTPQNTHWAVSPFLITRSPGRWIIFNVILMNEICASFPDSFGELLRFLWVFLQFGARGCSQRTYCTILTFAYGKTPGRWITFDLAPINNSLQWVIVVSVNFCHLAPKLTPKMSSVLFSMIKHLGDWSFWCSSNDWTLCLVSWQVLDIYYNFKHSCHLE